MAQRVGYFEDFASPEREEEAYSEGPFVMVEVFGWRIEAELKGNRCPVLPHTSVYPVMRDELGYIGKTSDREKVADIVDSLNQMVRDGRIVLDGNQWVLA